MKLISIIAGMSLLLGCQDKTTKTNANNADTSTKVEMPAGTTFQQENDLRIASYPNDSTVMDGAILNIATYHGDEVEPAAVDAPFYGLFKNKNGYYIDTASIWAEKVNDPIVDEDGAEHTGISIKCHNTDTNFLLIAGVRYFQKRLVQPANILTGFHEPHHYLAVPPGDTVSFIYAGVQYLLHAKGTVNMQHDLPNEKTVRNYQLYISAVKDRQHITQLLAAQPGFDDAQIEILFCGDMDGDNIPDFIIDTTNHYNVYRPTLYLSKQAGRGMLLKLVAMHTSVGC